MDELNLDGNEALVSEAVDAFVKSDAVGLRSEDDEL